MRRLLFVFLSFLLFSSFIVTSQVVVSDDSLKVVDAPLYSDFYNLSKTDLLPSSNGYEFSNVSTRIYDSKNVLVLKGNGLISYNLSKYGSEVAVPINSFLTFSLIDFGPISAATYVGMQFVMRAEDNSTKAVYVAKYYVGGFSNNSNSLLKFASPSLQYGMYWERWGVSTDLLYDFFGVSNLTMVYFRVIHASTISYNGDRMVYYQQPMFVSDLQRDHDAVGSYYGKTLRSNIVNISFKSPEVIFDPAEFINNSTVTGTSFNRVFNLIKYNQKQNKSESYIKLGGNGIFGYNLTDLGVNRSFSKGMNESLVFRWIDSGEWSQVTYIGVRLTLKASNGSSYSVYVAKVEAGYYGNSSASLFLHSDTLQYVNDEMQYFGVGLDPIFEYFGVTNLTIDSVQFINADSKYYYGHRILTYFAPLVVKNLTRGEYTHGVFLETRPYDLDTTGEKIVLKPVTVTETITVIDDPVTVTENYTVIDVYNSTVTVVSVNESVVTEYISDLSNINTSEIQSSLVPINSLSVIIAIISSAVILLRRRRRK